MGYVADEGPVSCRRIRGGHQARGRKEAFWRIVLLFLPLAVFGVLVIWPLLDTFYYSFTDCYYSFTDCYYSFTDWNGFSRDYRFVGR